jgi:UDP-N-acetylglucosamine 3-dehydrogenase
MSSVRLCMIGAGGHASRNMYPYFYQLRDAVVLANADLDRERANLAARRTGIERSYTDYHEMLRAERPDGVIVCVSSAFHARAAVELMEQGFHVYTEKPSCNTLAEAKAMLQAARRHDRICMTAYKKRFAPAYTRARAIIDSPDFGQPTLLTLLRTRGPHQPTADPSDAYLLQWGCHVVDLVCYLFGNVKTLSAMKTGPSPWAYAISFRFANDAIGTFAVTDRIKGRNWEHVTLIGSEGVAIQLDNSTELVASKHNQPFAAHRPDWVSGSSLGSVEQGYLGEIQAFVDAIRARADGQKDVSPQANIEQGAHTMAVYETIQRSAAEGGTLLELEAV